MNNKLYKAASLEEEEDEQNMKKKLYKAALRGEIDILTQDYNDEYFLRKTSQIRNNIIHVAVQQNQFFFVREVVSRFPKLICEGNCENNTPFHFAAKSGNLIVMNLLVSSYKEFIQKPGDNSNFPWRVKNNEGNTPLHVALIHGELPVAQLLVEEDPKLAGFRNNMKQTPLHLAVKHNIHDNAKSEMEAMRLEVEVLGAPLSIGRYQKKGDSEDMIVKLLETNSSVACWRDANGLTPLLQAALLNPPYPRAVELILDWCPQSSEVYDSTNGNTVLHLIIDGPFPSFFDLPYLFDKFPEIVALKNSQNFAGNTPSHIAMKHEDDTTLLLLMIANVNLTIKNKEGVYVADLIQQNPNFKKKLKFARKQYEHAFEKGRLKISKPENWSDIEKAVREINLSSLRKILKDPSRKYHLDLYSFIKRNILHELLERIALLQAKDGDWDRDFYHDLEEFVKQVSELLPSYFCETNYQDQNLLHVMAEYAPQMINKSILDLSRKCFEEFENSGTFRGVFSPPWRGLDIYGNTPLHHLILHARSLDIVHQVQVFISFDSTLGDYTNNNGMTPLHLLCECKFLVCLSDIMVEQYEVLKNMNIILESTNPVTLTKKDKDGMTPIMKASRSHCFIIVLSILQSGHGFSHLIDYLPNGQSYMHLIACARVSESNCKLIREIIVHSALSSDVFFHQDKEGNTPLHLAIEKGNFQFAKIFIIGSVKEATRIKALYEQNANRQTCLHLIANSTQGSSNDYEELLQEVEKLILQVPDVNLPNFLEALCCQDKDGNTALHLAIQKQNFQFAQLCITTATTTATAASNSYRNILEIRNDMKVSPGDLIGSAEILPNEFEQFLWSKPEVVEGMLGFRSLSGIPTTMIKEYVNTLGVTAALLATITFTAAFTVPGGLNNDSGTPLLMKKASFQVFMVSDIMAMCLSMMVLFCLLWIMTIGDRKRAVVLLDLTVFLLETSFYMTLLTFMTGLYVTTFPITPWIAILGCSVCSLLVLLMHKPFITGLIPAFIRMFVWSRKVYLSAKFSCCRTNRNTVQGNRNSGQPQADSDAKAPMVMPPSDTMELMTGPRPTSAHMITIDRSKQDGASTSSGIQ